MEGNKEEGVAFRQIDSVPEYTLCLLKKDITPNDEQIYKKVTENGTQYYKYYAITDDKKEKAYVATFEEAEEVIEKLKDKNSQNEDDIGIVEKYNEDETHKVTIFGTLRKFMPSVLLFMCLWILILIGWYVIGLPMGPSTYPTL